MRRTNGFSLYFSVGFTFFVQCNLMSLDLYVMTMNDISHSNNGYRNCTPGCLPGSFNSFLPRTVSGRLDRPHNHNRLPDCQRRCGSSLIDVKLGLVIAPTQECGPTSTRGQQHVPMCQKHTEKRRASRRLQEFLSVELPCNTPFHAQMNSCGMEF